MDGWDGWDWIGSPGGRGYRAPYGANNRRGAMSNDFDIRLKANTTVPKTSDIRTYKEIRKMFEG